MAKEQLTVTRVEALTRAGGVLKGNRMATEIPDITPGLFLRIWREGYSTWGVRYQLSGVRRWVALGDAVGKNAITLAAARADAAGIMSRVKKEGVDVWLERKAALVQSRADAEAAKTAEKAAAARISVADAIERYIAHSDRACAERRKEPNRERNRILQVEVAPRLGRIKLDDLTDDDVMGLVHRAIDNTSLHKGKKIYAEVRTFLNWAAEKTRPKLLPRSPLTSKGPEYDAERQRKLSVDEIRVFLSKLPEAPMTQPLRDVLELQLRLGQRVGEVLKMRRASIKLDEDAWVIPGKVAKNGKPTRVPLPPAAKAIIARVLADASNTTEWLFPAKDGQPYESWIAGRAMERAQALFGFVDKDGMPRLDDEGQPLTITTHDLRRTCATGLEDLDTPMDVIKMILNHTSEKDVSNRYARGDRFEVMYDALLRWELALERIVKGDNPFAVSQEDRQARAERIRAEMLGAAT